MSQARATDPMEWKPDTGMDDMGTGEEQRPGGEGGDDEAVEGPDDEDWEKGDGGAIPRAEGPAQDMASSCESFIASPSRLTAFLQDSLSIRNTTVRRCS